MNHAQRRRPRFLWTATLAGQKPPRRRNHNHHPPLLSEGISKVDQAVIKVMSTSDRGLGRGKRPDITLPLRCIDDTGSLRIAILCLCRNQPSKFDQAPRQTLGLRLKGSLGAPLERARTQRHSSAPLLGDRPTKDKDTGTKRKRSNNTTPRSNVARARKRNMPHRTHHDVSLGTRAPNAGGNTQTKQFSPASIPPSESPSDQTIKAWRYARGGQGRGARISSRRIDDTQGKQPSTGSTLQANQDLHQSGKPGPRPGCPLASRRFA